MNEALPKDPFLLLSYVNLKLRDFYPTLEDMCASLGIDPDALTQKLAGIDYEYSPERNQFV